MVLFPTINRLANPNNAGGLTGSRRRRLFVPPSTQYPLFIYGDGDDQRSFLSNIEVGSQIYSPEDDHSDVASVSTSRSLPSTLSSVQTADDQESFHDWLHEEHQRRISAASSPAGSSDEDEYEDDLELGRRRSGTMPTVISPQEDFLNLKTDYNLESKSLFKNSLPLILTFILEHIFSIVCLVVVGKLGTKQLGAVSLATMTSTITFAIFEGTATALDTLCPQAYGAGNYELMSIFVQRCNIFSMILFLPCALFWWFSGSILKYVIDDPEVVHLTQEFLRCLILGAPGYILFENSKRFLQAQGIFEAGTGILFVSAPINIGLSWFLVWNETYGIGYIGAPIATGINFWLMMILLVLYVRYIDGGKCWFGLASMEELFSNWNQIIHLAIPGIVMMESEYMAYEIMTLFASYFGTVQLAAQSAVSSIASLTYMVPFSVGIAATTRIANFIGGQNMVGAILATRVAMVAAVIVSTINCLALFSFRYEIARIFSDDPEVISLIVDLLNPLVSVLQIFDGIASVNSGILRAQGSQKIGGYINFIAYYAFALPLAMVLSKIVGLQVFGLWIGVGSGMAVIALSETAVIMFSNWDDILMKAGIMNEFGFDDSDDDGEDDDIF
ncbi:mate efflux family protein [Candida albicans]